jgi:Domain of unknown function (DUF1737)
MVYKIVEGTDTLVLEAKVNELIAEGWKPLGGPVAEGQGIYENWYQAMIKITKEAVEP